MQDEQLHRLEKMKKVESKTQAITNTKEFVPRFEPLLRPRLHHYEGFHYPLRDLPQRDLTQRNYDLVYTRLEYTTPPTQPSTQEVAQSQLTLQSTW